MILSCNFRKLPKNIYSSDEGAYNSDLSSSSSDESENLSLPQKPMKQELVRVAPMSPVPSPALHSRPALMRERSDSEGEKDMQVDVVNDEETESDSDWAKPTSAKKSKKRVVKKGRKKVH